MGFHGGAMWDWCLQMMPTYGSTTPWGYSNSAWGWLVPVSLVGSLGLGLGAVVAIGGVLAWKNRASLAAYVAGVLFILIGLNEVLLYWTL